MAINNLYSGDLAALTTGAIGAQDADTRSFDSARRYLAQLAQVKAEQNRTAALERTSARDAAIREKLGMGQLDLGDRQLSTQERLAILANTLQDKLGTGDLEVRRLGINNATEQAIADRLVREKLGLEEIGARKLGITTQADVAKGDQAVRRELGTKGLDVQEKLGLGDQSVSRERNWMTYDLGQGDQTLRRDLGMKEIDTRKEMATQALANQLALQRLVNEGGIEGIRAQGMYGSANPRLAEAALQIGAENQAADAAATAAASRANFMIPEAADEIGSEWYNPLNWVPGSGRHLETTYLNSLNPGGDRAISSRLMRAAMSKLTPEDASRVMVGPGGTNFVPVLRGAAPAGAGVNRITQLRQEAADALRTSAAYPDAANRQAMILERFKKLTGEDY